MSTTTALAGPWMPSNARSPQTTIGERSLNLNERIDAIEAGYEFMLAYAAQGRLTDSDASGSGVGFQLREFLGKMESALDGLGEEVAAVARQHGTDGRGIEDFLDAVALEDARKTLGLARPAGQFAARHQLHAHRQRQRVHSPAGLADGPVCGFRSLQGRSWKPSKFLSRGGSTSI